jgi:predicted lipid-binding transport protein (Tim44 family)
MDNSLMEILFFALLAGVAVFKLSQLLGREDLNDIVEKKATTPDNVNVNNVIDIATRKEPEAQKEIALKQVSHLDSESKEALNAIIDQDIYFLPKDFLNGAQLAFEEIINAFAKKDTSTLQGLLSKPLYEKFENAIKQREEREETLETVIVAIIGANIKGMAINDHTATITVRVISEQIHLLKDKEDKIISGNPSDIEKIEDSWVFEKNINSSDPNWTLKSTGGA